MFLQVTVAWQTAGPFLLEVLPHGSQSRPSVPDDSLGFNGSSAKGTP